jgi:predicted extracellular nuclease/endonuclease I
MNSLMKKTLLASAMSLTLPTTAMANIIITEYVEGSSNNKAVEISNIGSTDIDMGAEGYKLAMYVNGSPTEHDDRKIELTGVLAAGQSYILYNGSADPEFQFPDNGAESSVTWFNGDDALVLSKNGVVVDSFGRVGEDPGSEWIDPNIDGWSSKEKTLRRKVSITEGDTVIDDAFPSSPNQWEVFDQNTADGLGCSGVTACNAEPTASIIITEYVEGSGSNKAVEITNISGADVDMTGYKLALHGNGDVEEHPDRKVELTGMLAAGASYVVYNESADAEFQFPNNGIASSLTFFNGDDAIVLSYNGEVVDSFGRVGEDPGSEWTDPNDPNWSTKEKTLRRKDSVTTGDTIVDDEFPGSDNQWLAFDQNTADGLGCRGEVACSGGGGEPTDPTPAANTIVITEYVEGSSNNKAVEISNLGTEAVDMGAMKYAIVLFGNGGTEPGNRLDLTGMLEPGASFVAFNDGAAPEFQFTENGVASNITWYNGDDALVLLRDEVIVDSFGRVGEDPGSAWTDANNPEWSTQNKTLRRKATVTSGDSVADDEFPGANNEWLVFDIDNWRGLGCPGETFCPGNDPVPTNYLLITEYVEGSDKNRAIELTNTGVDAVDLATMEYALAFYNDGYDGVHSSAALAGIIEPGASFVIYNPNAAEQFQFPDAGMASEYVDFTGDDVVALTIQGNIVDSIGRIGEDPGEGWTASNDENWSTYNRTLRRLPFVTEGDAVATDEFPGATNEWLAFDIDTASGLGCSGVVACDGSDGSDAPENILITEYVEGSGSNKVIELTNMGEAAVNMAAGSYKLALFTNGDSEEHPDRKIFLTATLEPGESFMIYNESADSEFQFPNNGEASTATFFNGDDAIVLTRNGEVIDSLGRVGEDPGDEWLDPNDPDFSTKERTIRRKESVTEGDTVVDDAFPGDENEWVSFPQNTSNGLGCAGVASCDGDDDTIDPSEVENFIIITEYVEGSGSNKAVELTNVGETDVDLMVERYRLATYNNGNTSESNSLNLFGLLPPGASIVVYNRDAEEQFQKAAPQGIGSNVTFFNGDDAVVLTKGGIPVDSLGRVGQDPGDMWTDSSDENFATRDKTIRRKAEITQGDYTLNDNFPGEMNQWVTFDINTADGLGCGGEGACTGEEPMALVGAGGGVTFGACINCSEISKVTESSLFDDATYYAAVMEAAPLARGDAIKELLKGSHVRLTYSQVWSVLTFADEDPANTDNIIEIYTGNSIAKNMNGSGENANNPDSWNREHVWSKSHGFPNESQLAYTDAHNLRPADWSMNSTRSNLNFDNGGDPIEESPINFKDDDSFEPRDEVKGDVARMLFYMASRYNGDSADSTPDLTLVDRVDSGTATVDGQAFFGKLCTLWEWHLNDPVSEAEKARNEVVFQYQGNRNPFIDHPEWAYDAHSWACRPHNPPVAVITGPLVVAEDEMVTLDASNATDPEGHSFTYEWVLPEGLDVSIDDEASVINFNAPFVAEATEFTVMLKLTDEEMIVGEQTYTFTVDNTNLTGPEISINGPVSVPETQSVTIDASASTDADGYAISYHWRQTTNSHISFEYDGASISFIAPSVNADTPITFELTITDGEYETVETYTVVIEDTTESNDLGGSMGIISLLLLPLLAMRRRVSMQVKKAA